MFIMMYLTSKSIIIVLILGIVADAARILGVFPHPAYSHQVVFRALTIELARRGHELIVFTTDPVNDSTLNNYIEVDLHFIYKHTLSNVNYYSKKDLGYWSFLHSLYSYNEKITDQVLSHPIMQRLIERNSTEKFDLILVNCLLYDAIYALSFRFDAPLIGITGTSTIAIHHYLFGNPITTILPDVSVGYDDNMNMWQRMVNVYYQVRQVYEYNTIVLPIQEKMSKKYFGDSVPPVHQLASNISLLMTYEHPFFIYPRANTPAIVHIGGSRYVSKEREREKSLPEDLKKMLDEAKEGCIYFSLGSNIKSKLLPVEKRNMFLRIFARLSYKVLWKFESDLLEDKPSNVMIRKWVPQQEILAHPNVRLFIYQGGMQSTEETINSGTPVIGLPCFFDQVNNVRRLLSYGVGKMLDLNDIDEKQFRNTIVDVMTNSSYKQNMLKLRNLWQDLPYQPMDYAVWWVEHVIRHKGAPHLQNKARNVPWYQIYLIDIIALIFVAIALVIHMTIMIKRFIFKLIIQLITQMKRKLKEFSREKQQ